MTHPKRCYDDRMRTTVTLDPDVEVLIRRAMKERGLSFKEAVNSTLRVGLTQTKPGKRHFVQKTFALGTEQSFRWDNALAAADAIEDEELSRKLSLRK
jgi:hypothetical protein